MIERVGHPGSFGAAMRVPSSHEGVQWPGSRLIIRRVLSSKNGDCVVRKTPKSEEDIKKRRGHRLTRWRQVAGKVPSGCKGSAYSERAMTMWGSQVPRERWVARIFRTAGRATNGQEAVDHSGSHLAERRAPISQKGTKEPRGHQIVRGEASSQNARRASNIRKGGICSINDQGASIGLWLPRDQEGVE